MELLLQARRFGLVRSERRHQPRRCLRIELRSRLVRTIHGVAHRLRCLVGELARSERLESDLAFIESVLRDLASAVELSLELVPDCHGVSPLIVTLRRTWEYGDAR